MNELEIKTISDKKLLNRLYKKEAPKFFETASFGFFVYIEYRPVVRWRQHPPAGPWCHVAVDLEWSYDRLMKKLLVLAVLVALGVVAAKRLKAA